jgi:hypothetical protein
VSFSCATHPAQRAGRTQPRAEAAGRCPGGKDNPPKAA